MYSIGNYDPSNNRLSSTMALNQQASNQLQLLCTLPSINHITVKSLKEECGVDFGPGTKKYIISTLLPLLKDGHLNIRASVPNSNKFILFSLTQKELVNVFMENQEWLSKDIRHFLLYQRGSL